MAEVRSLPRLETYYAGEPPLPPFQWKLVNMGPVDVEYLFDARGRQIFNRSSAITRKVGTTDIMWPERGDDEEDH